jgi:uncharacterized protein YbjQ (UPF0145 family)
MTPACASKSVPVRAIVHVTRRACFKTTLPMPADILTTTANALTGFHINQELGVVRGIIVRSRSIVGSIGAGIQTLFGGNISIYTKLCEQARSEAFELMKQHAEAVGANAIIAMRYDATEVAPGVTEVLCYGTAVVVQRG